MDSAASCDTLYFASDASTRSRGNIDEPSSTVAGATPFTRTSGANATASSRTRWFAAALLVSYANEPALGTTAFTLVVMTRLPARPCAFQIRHASPYVKLAKRVHAGEIGTPVSGEIHYFASAIKRPEWADATPQARRLRNWVHDIALSGDIIVEQNIHIIDVTNWLLKANPVKAVGSASRAGRTDQGDCSSHYNCVFTYPGNVHVSFASTQFTGAKWGGVGMQYYGTKGWAEARYDAPVRISAESEWEFPGLKKPEPTDAAAAVTGAFRGALDDADPNKQKAFIESITSGNLVNEAQSGVDSALACMLGREAAATGKEVTWEKLLKSKTVFDPKIDWKPFV